MSAGAIPEHAFSWKAVRASGPGGQNVNKVASKVELRVDLSRVPGLDAAALERLRRLPAVRCDATGRLLITSQRSRDQGKNLADAKRKAETLVARAMVTPAERKRTRPSGAARERRLQAKRRVKDTKRSRGRVAAED